MENIADKFRTRRRIGLTQDLSRGASPKVELTDYSLGCQGFFVFLITVFVVFICVLGFGVWKGENSFLNAFFQALFIASNMGLLVTLLYYILPILKAVGYVIWNRRRPSREYFKQFSLGQLFVCVLLISIGLFFVYNRFFGGVTIGWHMVVIVFFVFVALAYLFPLLFPKGSAPIEKKLKITKETPFGLWLGQSTGQLAKLWHRTGLEAHLEVVTTTEDAAQNILVLGGIGSGKTTRLMQPLLVQLLDQECGGLLFDVKGDVKTAAEKLGNRAVTIIGPNHNQMNLLAGLTPEVAASFLKSGFLLGGTGKADPFWVDTATELCRNTLGVLSFLPDYYSLGGLYSYLFDKSFRVNIQEKIQELVEKLEGKEHRLLKTYLNFHESVFESFDEKVKSGLNATCSQALSPFSHPELVDAFCEQSQTSMNMQSVLDGVVFLVDIPLARWGLGGKVAYTFIKLRFFNLMQNRVHHPEWDQGRPVFFMCDEYQELISASKDGLSDINFWDKSRSSKTIGIVSAQSVSSFYSAIGNRDLAHAILQNFRQKFCFRTEDEATIYMMDRLAGQARIKRKTIGQSISESLGRNSMSHSESISEARDSILDATLFRNLSPNQAVALLSIGGQSMDDVLELKPVFF